MILLFQFLRQFCLFPPFSRLFQLTDYLYNKFIKDNGAGVGVNLNAGNGYGFNANVGLGNQVNQDFAYTGPVEYTWYESPSDFDRADSIEWKTASDGSAKNRRK